MNYPKPDKLDSMPQEAACEYLYVPGYGFTIEVDTSRVDFYSEPYEINYSNPNAGRLVSVPIFNSEEQTTRVREVELTGHVIELIIENKHHQRVNDISIFNTYKNQSSQNFGNTLAVEVRAANSNQSYAEILQQAGNNVLRIGMMRIKTLQGETPDKVNLVYECTYDNGDFRSRPIRILRQPWQMQMDVIDIDPPLDTIIQLFSGFRLDMPANTTIKLSLWPAAVMNITDSFSGLFSRHRADLLENRDLRRAAKAERKAAKMEALRRRRGLA